MESSSGSMPHSASDTPVPISGTRRSARISTTVNSQEKYEVQEENSKVILTTPQNKKKTSIILRHNSPNTPSTSQGKKATSGIEMAGFNNETALEKRSGRSNTASGCVGSLAIADPSGRTDSQSTVSPWSETNYSPSSPSPIFGREIQLGYGGSLATVDSSSSQPSSSLEYSGFHKDQEASAHEKGPRVPGMPSVMPRSNTPPPTFDTKNPFSAFSEQPAIPQRRPSAISGRSTLPHSLPSLPSDEVLSNALQDSIQNHVIEAQDQVDHTDPLWRHPWGIPVTPLEPGPMSYVPPQPSIPVPENSSARQQYQGDDVFYGFPENGPITVKQPVNLDFLQFLIDNPQSAFANYSNDPEDYLNYPADLSDFNNYPQDPHALPGEQAGDSSVFPNYPYGFDLPALRPVAEQGVKAAHVGNALMLFQNQTKGIISQGADEEDVRQSIVVSSIMCSLRDERTKAEKTMAKGKATANPQTQRNYQSQPEFQNLALGKVKKARLEDVSHLSPGPSGSGSSAKGEGKIKVSRTTSDCTFCLYACDWGVLDESVRLPEEASAGWCPECGDPNTGSFFEAWTTIMENRGDQASTDAVEKARSQSVHPTEIIQHQGQKVYSAIDGTDITKFMGPMFCKSCPWGQIDATKARICEIHRNEKFAIIKHRRHQEFRNMGHSMPEDIFPAQQARGMNMNDVEDIVRVDAIKHDELNSKFKDNKRCMMCTGTADSVCVGCPLRLCSTCEVLLRNICKGYLDNLFYHFGRHHLRNDAFLLRSDGNGF